MIAIEFDDIIYSLQRFGGASEYWNAMTSRVDEDDRFCAKHRRPSRWARGIPVIAKCDIFHSSHFRTNLSLKAKTVATVHDMNYELGYVSHGVKARINILERKLAYFTADALICISHSTQRELLEVYPALANRCPIRVVHHGYTRFGADASIPRPPFPPYVLHVGARKGYKSFLDVLEAFHTSGLRREGVRLICTGHGFDEQERKQIARFDLNDSVISVGNVDRCVMGTLYRHAHCLVYASIHEGFGLPLLEAMHCGCPVVAYNTSCMPEIAGDAAILVEPHSPSKIAEAVVSLQDEQRRRDVQNRGKARAGMFSWERSAEGHMTTYFSLLS